MPNATVTVFVAGTQIKAPLFSDDGLTAQPNPTFTNNLGVFNFFVADGRYDINVSGPNIVAFTQTNVEISDVTDASAADLSWQTEVLNFASQSSTATPPAGFMSVYTKSSPKHLFVKDDAGNETDLFTSVGTGSQPPLGSLQYDNAGGLGGSNFIYVPNDTSGQVCTGPCDTLSATTNNAGISGTATDGTNFFTLTAEPKTGFGSNLDMVSQVAASPTRQISNGVFVTASVSGSIGANQPGLCRSAPGPACASAGWFNAATVPGDSVNGQALTGLGGWINPLRTASQNFGYGAAVVAWSPGGNSGLTPAEKGLNVYGVDIEDQKGLSTVDTAALRIQAQTPPSSGTQWAIEALPGAGPSQLDSYLALNPTLFASLGNPVNGSTAYCSDCTATSPCTGGGNGAFAQRLNGVWNCAAQSTGGLTNFSFTETGLDGLLTASVSNPTTTPNLSMLASTTQPGMVLAGPIPVNSTSNPVFELANVATSTGTSVAVTATPAAATSVALFFGTTGAGQNVPVPDGTWSSFPGTPLNGSLPRFKNLSSSARLTAASTISVSDSWSASLAFLGGSITSIPQTVAFSGCGTGCASGTLGSVTAGHVIAVYGYWATISGITPNDIRATDNLGNVYQTAAISPNAAVNGNFLLIAQQLVTGAPTITVRTSTPMNFGAVGAWELVGPTAYYTGSTGPWAFRRLGASDLGPLLGNFQSQISTTTTCPTGGAAGSTCNFTITWPVAFSDSNYAVSCMGGGSITGFPVIQGFTGKTASGLTVVVENGTNNEAQISGYSEMDCFARHA